MHLLNHYTDLTLTQDQEQAVRQLEDFLSQNNCPVFLLKGYAGSGKTTLLSGLISYLKEQKKTFQLMAPTGRAAKVIQQKTGHEANTIHRTIYSFQNLKEVPQKTSEDAPSFHYVYELSTYSVDPDHLFIIDEASLVSDAYSENEFFRFGSGYLLRDLISYSQVQNPESRIKILFVGDPAQLPPVGMNSSPALDATYLAKHFQLTSQEVELKEVKRQSSAAGILAMATALRRSITSETFNDFQLPLRQQDLIQLPVSRFMEYYAPLPEPKMLICYQNKTAQKLNRAIRKYRYPGQAQMQVGDRVIIAKNNPQLQLFNGEFAEIRAIGSRSESREVPIKNGEKVRLTWRHVELYRDDDTGGPHLQRFFLREFPLCRGRP
ncbi:ATP-dependent DNA helicase [Nitritalea halalkaliphila]|uniref:ATP-dependent DNA helicase n=1 Tax=Nitritalea halalkaliphila TaxID=590849 RepID=UPI0012EAEEA3|nr:AAA family ATPase [Nitritalea halalkaliphila]